MPVELELSRQLDGRFNDGQLFWKALSEQILLSRMGGGVPVQGDSHGASLCCRAHDYGD